MSLLSFCMDKNNIISRVNQYIGQNKKNGTFANIFLPVKNTIAIIKKLMQLNIDNIAIATGCHSKSY